MRPRAVAVNVGANTNVPGFRAPIHSDLTFEFLPISESEPTAEPVPTYDDLAPELALEVPPELRETPVHLDPTFAEYPGCDWYTYGDPHPVKAGPLSELAAGDLACFYATLSVDGPAEELPPDWGAFLIGHFRLASPPITAAEWPDLGADERVLVRGNAHLRRTEMDARVLLVGDPAASGLYERAVPLSRPTGGAAAGPLVTEHSADSGRGPWWRRPLRFDEDGTEALLEHLRETGANPGCYHR